ncbi:Glutathione S-transferase family protein [Rhynchospora pubera]|uniref:glutathione transferase n=1 Tax=Rhynchospora pubera TaxID=906938 RepID=A0AAV8E3Q5_9POAL|nr:Glutathione S-transferase family protein [Rhynchospora pubera]
MAIKVYGLPVSNNALRAMATLNEKELEYELCPVDLQSGAHKKPEFLALNPFGQIPVVQDGDEIIFESRAISRYIATKYKESGADLLPVNSAKFETWLQVESSQFYPAISELNFELLFKPMFGMTTDMSNVEKQAEKLSAVLDVYEAHLAKNKYMAGEVFTLADLNHMPEIFLLLKSPKAELITSKPHVKAWWEDISARPAWKKTAASIPL